MANFVLIHGAWHGPECWYKIVSLLKQDGHNVTLLDLNKDLETLQDYVDYVGESLPNDSIIIGHSMAGLILSSLPNKYSSKIKSLVYLCAFMLEDGQNLLDISSKFPSQYLKLNFTDDFKICSLAKESAIASFYNKCREDDIQFALAHLKPQNYRVFNNKIRIDLEKYNKIPKFYIKCLLDNAVLVSAQEYMIEKQQLTEVYSLKTDHSPFFSAHMELAKILGFASN